MNNKPIDELSSDVIADIFSERAATDANDFILSTLFERRQSVSDNDVLISETIKHRTLPSWLDTPGYLGPYERTVLSRIFQSTNNLIIFRSGTGSGKSSLLSCLAAYANSESVIRKIEDQSATAFKNTIHILDFEETQEEFHDEIKKEDDRVHYYENIKSITGLFADKLRNTFVVNMELIDDEKSIEFFALVLRKTLDCHVFQNGFSRDVLMEIDNNIGSIDRYSTSEYFSVFERAVNKLDDEQRRAYAWLLIWVNASKISFESRSAVPFVIAIDNIDQIAGYLQFSIGKLLQNFFTDEYNRRSSLKILFMMRLATAYDNISSLPTARIIRSHEAPNIVDLMTVRLTEFLLDPSSVPSFCALEDDAEKSRIFGRIYSFYLGLLDARGFMRSLLQGLSGTNLRLAQMQATKWMLSPNNRSRPLGRAQREDISKNLFDDIVPNAVSKLTRAIGRAIKAELAELSGALIDYPLDPRDGSEQTFTIDVARQIALIFVHSRILEPDDRALLTGRRASVGRRVGINIATAIESGANENLQPDREELVNHIARILMSSRLFQEDFEFDFPSHLLLYSSRELLRNVENELNRNGYKSSLVVDHFCKITNAAIEKCISEKNQDSLYEERHKALKYRNIIEIDYSHNRFSTSRYQNAAIMLESSKIHQDKDLSPINLYHSSSNSTPFPLYILHRMHERKPTHSDQNMVTYESLYADLKTFKIPEDELSSNLKSFVRRDRRLIFSGIHDEETSVDSWKNSPDKAIRLTWSGYRYLTDVAICPPYIQWAFDRDRELSAIFWDRNKSRDQIHHRFEYALFVFEKYINQESTRMTIWRDEIIEAGNDDQVARRLMSHIGFACRMPLVDMFIRSMPRFVDPIERTVDRTFSNPKFRSGAVGNIDLETAQRTLSLIDVSVDWIDRSLEYIELSKTLFTDIPEEWEVIYEYCRSQNDEFLEKNVRQIKRLRSGQVIHEDVDACVGRLAFGYVYLVLGWFIGF